MCVCGGASKHYPLERSLQSASLGILELASLKLPLRPVVYLTQHSEKRYIPSQMENFHNTGTAHLITFDPYPFPF